jgi:type IV secretion system protein VirB10
VYNITGPDAQVMATEHIIKSRPIEQAAGETPEPPPLEVVFPVYDFPADAYRADYGAYDRRPAVEIRESPAAPRPLAASGSAENPYGPPVDPCHEIKAGAYIPITLVSAVHSDLPGPIEAQVVGNVYDTYSGRNVLIPKGARVHGGYSASAAFGQDRVLIAWQRMTLPDGVSVSLHGTRGVDLSGMAGLADKVDHHIAELTAALGISTVFDPGRAAVTSAMSTVDFLKDINTILTARGSATTAANSASRQIVAAYAEKLMNRQPTITVREGTRGNVFVSKDIILPSYGASF